MFCRRGDRSAPAAETDRSAIPPRLKIRVKFATFRRSRFRTEDQPLHPAEYPAASLPKILSWRLEEALAVTAWARQVDRTVRRDSISSSSRAWRNADGRCVATASRPPLSSACPNRGDLKAREESCGDRGALAAVRDGPVRVARAVCRDINLSLLAASHVEDGGAARHGSDRDRKFTTVACHRSPGDDAHA